MTAEIVAQVQDKVLRNALQTRLQAFDNDPKKAVTGKNSIEKNPIWIDEDHTQCVPDQVTIRWFEKQFTIRKAVDKDLNLDKVVDEGVRRIQVGLVRDAQGHYLRVLDVQQVVDMVLAA